MFFVFFSGKIHFQSSKNVGKVLSGDFLDGQLNVNSAVPTHPYTNGISREKK